MTGRQWFEGTLTNYREAVLAGDTENITHWGDVLWDSWEHGNALVAEARFEEAMASTYIEELEGALKKVRDVIDANEWLGAIGISIIWHSDILPDIKKVMDP